MIMGMTQVTQKWRQSSILVHHTHYYMILRERGICGTFDWVSSRIIWGITVSSPRPSQQKGILMGFLSSTFGPGIIPLRTYTQQGGAPSGRPSETLWEKTGGGNRQPSREPSMWSSIRMSRQTTCPVHAHPPGEGGQGSHVSRAFHRLCPRETITEQASVGEHCWLSTRRCTVVTALSCLSEGPGAPSVHGPGVFH